MGAYELVDQKLPPKLSVDAQIKLAIHATFDTQKWNQTGSSIPTHVASEPPPERPEVPRPPLKQSAAFRGPARDFNAGTDAATRDVGPGSYDLRHDPGADAREKAHAPFGVSVERTGLYEAADRA